MAFELKEWKAPGCVLFIDVDALSDRERSSKEINDSQGEGGGLNADYRQVEAATKVANFLGLNGYVYGKDFVLKTIDSAVTLDFCNRETMELVHQHLKASHDIHGEPLEIMQYPDFTRSTSA